MMILSSLLLTLVSITSSLANTSILVRSEGNNQNIIGDKAVYALSKSFDKPINTFEAWIKLPTHLDDTKKGGVILGNYINNSFGYNGASDYLIDTNGNFRLYYNRISGIKAEVDHIFTSFDFRTGKYEHLALTRDTSNDTFTLYVNGEKMEEYVASSTDAVNSTRYQIGCDWRNWTKNIDGENIRLPFQGEIKSVSLYDNALTQAQIQTDMNKDVLSDSEHLLGSYYIPNWGEEEIVDVSSNHNNAILYNYEKYIDVKETEEFDYSILCIPDIQITTRYSPSKLDADFDWMVNNKDKENIQYISFVGDLTDTCDMINGERVTTYPQWNAVKRNFEKLDANNIAYGFVPGNHDYDDGVGRSRPLTIFNQFLPYAKYSEKSYFGQSYFEGDMSNYYDLKKINGVDYMFMNLEFGPRDSVLLWANRAIEERPNHRVVISTHSYIEPDGRITDSKDSYAASRYGIGGGNSSNDGIDMWNKLVKKHPNIFIVFSGHNSSDDIIYRTDIGEHGNKIHSFLIDAQGSLNSASCDVLSIFKINENEKRAYVYWYSPYEGKYLNRQNQFVIDFKDEKNPVVGLPSLRKANLKNHKTTLFIAFACIVPAVMGVTTAVVLTKKGGKKDEEN